MQIDKCITLTSCNAWNARVEETTPSVAKRLATESPSGAEAQETALT